MDFATKLAESRIKENPFDENNLNKARLTLCSDLGLPPGDERIAERQPLCCRLCAGLLRAAGDPIGSSSWT